MREKKQKETLSEQKTLPIQAPDQKNPLTKHQEQSPKNVKRSKRWGEEHST